jgi:hypothetical protein
VSSKLRILDLPLRLAACAATLGVLEASLWLYEKQHSKPSTMPKHMLPQGATPPISASSPIESGPPRPKTDRERAIDGFIRNCVDRIGEGEFGHADYLAKQVFRFNEMTDQEFAAEFAN